MGNLLFEKHAGAGRKRQFVLLYISICFYLVSLCVPVIYPENPVWGWETLFFGVFGVITFTDLRWLANPCFYSAVFYILLSIKGSAFVLLISFLGVIFSVSSLFGTVAWGLPNAGSPYIIQTSLLPGAYLWIFSNIALFFSALCPFIDEIDFNNLN
jgi:hypothetical protein